MSNKKNNKIEKRKRIHKKIRSKISGTAELPRVCVYKSNRDLMVQFIDDVKRETLLAESSLKISGKNKTEKSKNLGISLAEKALKKGYKKIVFDRGGFIYAGRIKAFSEGLREAGLEF